MRIVVFYDAWNFVCQSAEMRLHTVLVLVRRCWLSAFEAPSCMEERLYLSEPGPEPEAGPVLAACEKWLFFFCCQMRSPGILCGWTVFLLVDGDGRGRAGGSRCFRPAFLAAEQKALPGDARPLFHKSCPKSCPGSFSGSFSGSSPSFSPKDSSLVQQNANPVKRQMTCQSSVDKFSRKV